MGTWGPGLYSNDIAKDLKSTIAAVVRLPFDATDLAQIISGAFPESANDASDEDHATFWLVLADQFHRKGIDCPSAFDRALQIVASGADLNAPSVLEMSAGDQRKREKALCILRDQIEKPVDAKTRKTLKKPQPLIFDVGEVVVFPVTESGACFNPYITKATWTRADWGAAVIIGRGCAFDFLAYYTPIVINRRLNVSARPTFGELTQHEGWRLARQGTCSKAHFNRMQLETVGKIETDAEQISETFPDIRDGRYAAVNDISLCNGFYVHLEPREHDANINSLTKLMKEAL